MGVNEFQSVLSHSSSDLFGIGSVDLLITLLNISDFRENRLMEDRTVLMEVRDVTLMWALRNQCVPLKIKEFLQSVYCFKEKMAGVFAVQSDTLFSLVVLHLPSVLRRLKDTLQGDARSEGGVPGLLCHFR